MRGLLLIVFSTACLIFEAQDKVYFKDGRTKICTVQAIGPDEISIKQDDYEQNLSRLEVLLIEYKNGSAEIINLPTEDKIYQASDGPLTEIKKERKNANSYVSVNTLALCNADASAFYEYRPNGKIFAFGLMGAYNFNVKSSLQNVFIKMLPNGKKNFDIGATVNLYALDVSEELNVYFGLLFKYTDLTFHKVHTDTTGGSNVVTYTPARGSQLSTLFTAGTHTFINDKLFVRSMLGLGAFKLKGDYKETINKEINSNNEPGDPDANYNFLPKMYLGIMIGFNF